MPVVRILTDNSSPPISMGIKGFTATLSSEVADEKSKLAIIQSPGVLNTGVCAIKDCLSLAILPEKLLSTESQTPMLAEQTGSSTKRFKTSKPLEMAYWLRAAILLPLLSEHSLHMRKDLASRPYRIRLRFS